MTPALSAAISGLRAQSTVLAVSAHNVANVNTDGFKKQRVSMAASPYGGVVASVGTIDTPGVLLLKSGLDGLWVETANVEFQEEAVTRISGTRAYEAILVVIEQEMRQADELFRAVA